MDPTEAAALLDEIAEEGCSLFEMESEFRKRAESPGDPVVKTAVAALQYSLTESDEPRRETYGPFVPMLETGGAVIPPYTSDLDRDVLATWERLVGIVESPIVAARLHDLLWVTRSGSSPHEHARARSISELFVQFIVLIEIPMVLAEPPLMDVTMVRVTPG